MEWQFDDDKDVPLYPSLPVLAVVTERGIEIYGSSEFLNLKIVHQPALCWKVSPEMVRQLEIEGERFVMGNLGREHQGIFTPSCLLGLVPNQPFNWEQIARAQQELKALSALEKMRNGKDIREAPRGDS